MINKELWLDHLMQATPIEGYGNRISIFLISLEAWRRGIGVKFYTIKNPENRLLIRYSLSYNNRTFNFNSALSEQMSKEAFDICENKYLTKKKLSESGIRVPKGEKLTKDTDLDHLVSLASKLSYPVVMKPIDEKAGKGVFSNITDENMLLKIFKYLTIELGYDEVLLEEFIEGEEHRILTVGNKVVGIVKRIPANVIGNGKDTINQLIRDKNKSKQTNPVIYTKTIDIDRELKNQLTNAGYDLNDVLEKNKRVFVRSKSNISTGGDPIDVMDNVDPAVIEMAEKAIQAIPGLEVSGLDMIINPETKEKAIIEINTRPMIGLHVFPEGGKPRDVVKDIVDYYFPETKNIERSRLYFDFGTVIKSLDGVATKEISLNKIVPEPYFAKQYIISINENKHLFQRDIRRKALSNNIYGHAKGAGPKLLEVILASPSKERVESFFENYYQETEYVYDIISENEWKYAINVGFKTATYSENITLLERHLKKSQENRERLINKHKREVYKLTQEYEASNEQVSIYKESLFKVRSQNKQLKEKQIKNRELIKKQKKEIIELKKLINKTWYRRLIKSKRV